MWSLISLLFRDRESVAAYQPLPLSDMYPSLETLSFETWANSAERGFGFWCRLPWALLGVNSSTAGAALTSGAFAESGCAARLPRSTLHLLGKKGGGGGEKCIFNYFMHEVILQRPAALQWSQRCLHRGCSLGTVTPGAGSVESFFSNRRFNPFSFLTAE